MTSGINDPILSPDAFRASILVRDGHACVICGARNGQGVNLVAHHILDRRLWEDGGYPLRPRTGGT